MQIEEFVNDWIGERSEDSKNSYRSDLRIFKRFLDQHHLTPETMQRCQMRQFVNWSKTRENPKANGRPISESTVQRQLSTIRCYYRWAQDKDSSHPDPTAGFKFRRTEEPREVLPVEAEVSNAMCGGAATKGEIAIVQVFRRTGIRIREMVRLDKDSFLGHTETDESGGARNYATVRVFGKGRKSRIVIFDEITLNAIADYMEERGDDNEPALFMSRWGKRISRRTVQRIIRRLSFDTAAVHVHPHQFRHSFATEMIEAGMQDAVLQKLLGHKNLPTTWKYIRISDSTVARQYYAARARMEAEEKAGSGRDE